MTKRERKNEVSLFCIELGKHLRTLRKERGLSIEEIAFKAEIDAQNLRKYELGRQEMKISMLKRIATAFDLTTSELLVFDKKP
ncbi:helix-turn-helix domain-containing protein [Mesoflavibacter profundi]|uniref:helix-turn-helix domain-containing protein n=1 Tax=Mesoflavibacter profundi TaxID=2708110 RepID=UPI00168AD4F6|nr:helix-turn-helix transcriptional regulator [Mesoflavibacter profundi]